MENEKTISIDPYYTILKASCSLQRIVNPWSMK
jgi:hypothetical protein